MENTIKDSQFYKDLTNSGDVNRGYLNLIISIRDIKLFQLGLKPNRFWKIRDVKKYFGILGTAKQIQTQLEEILTTLKKD